MSRPRPFGSSRLRVAEVIAGAFLLVSGASGWAWAAESAGEFQAQIDQAVQLKGQNRYEDALALLRSVVEKAGENKTAGAIAQCRIGDCYLAMAQPDKAQAELEKVAVHYPQEQESIGWARVMLCDALTWQGKPGEAEAVARRLLEDYAAGKASPVKAGWARVKLGGLLKDRGAADEALTLLQGVSELPLAEPSPIVHANTAMGQILIGQGKPAEAVAPLEVASRQAEVDAHARNWARVILLNAYTHSNRPDDAIRLSQEVVLDHAAGKASDEQAARALIWRARALADKREYDAAKDPPQMALAVLNKGNPGMAYEARYLLGEICRWQADATHDEREEGYRRDAAGHYLLALEMAQSSKLDEDAQNLARLQAGTQMCVSGQRERGLALLRVGIVDPGKAAGGDGVLAERIGSLLSPAEAQAWTQYLEDPSSRTDPLAGYVAAELGTVAPAAKPAEAEQSFQRSFWLGKMYHAAGSFEKALACFEEAERLTNSPAEVGTALYHSVLTHVARAQYLQRFEPSREAQQAWEAARANARRGAEQLLAALPDNSGGQAHWIIEQAVCGYVHAQAYDQALITSERVVESLGREAPPSKIAFAEYVRMQALAWNGRYAEAVRAGEQLDIAFRDYPDGDIREICLAALLKSSVNATLAGDPDAGRTRLQMAAARYGARAEGPVVKFRGMCERIVARTSR